LTQETVAAGTPSISPIKKPSGIGNGEAGVVDEAGIPAFGCRPVHRY
jgi:hypothetical protein